MRFFQAARPSSRAGTRHIGSLKKPHHIITLRFSEVVKDHAKYTPCEKSTLPDPPPSFFFLWHIEGSIAWRGEKMVKKL